MHSSVPCKLQQLPALLQCDSQAAELCGDCAVLQPNLPQAGGAGNLEGQGQHTGVGEWGKAIVNYLVLSWCMNLVSGLQYTWQVITDLELLYVFHKLRGLAGSWWRKSRTNTERNWDPVCSLIQAAPPFLIIIKEPKSKACSLKGRMSHTIHSAKVSKDVGLWHGSRASSKISVHLQLVKWSTSYQLLWYLLHAVSTVLSHVDCNPRKPAIVVLGCQSIACCEHWDQFSSAWRRPTTCYPLLLSSG